jgi:hypothetical protein
MFVGTDASMSNVTETEAVSERGIEKMFGPKRGEVTEKWRKLHKEELHNLYSSPNIVKVTKSRSMRWETHIVRLIEERNTYKILVVQPEGKSYLNYLDVDGV